jgi:hypothetical protein
MLDKAIISGKEHRKPFRGSKAIDHTCRNHGSCAYCRENRLYNRKKLEKKFEKDLTDFNKYGII